MLALAACSGCICLLFSSPPFSLSLSVSLILSLALCYPQHPRQILSSSRALLALAWILSRACCIFSLLWRVLLGDFHPTSTALSIVSTTLYISAPLVPCYLARIVSRISLYCQYLFRVLPVGDIRVSAYIVYSTIVHLFNPFVFNDLHSLIFEQLCLINL